MWIEPPAGIPLQSPEAEGSSRLPLPAEVVAVEPGSIGEDLGFECGYRLLSINGIRPRDLIDFQIL